MPKRFLKRIKLPVSVDWAMLIGVGERFIPVRVPALLLTGPGRFSVGSSYSAKND